MCSCRLLYSEAQSIFREIVKKNTKLLVENIVGTHLHTLSVNRDSDWIYNKVICKTDAFVYLMGVLICSTSAERVHAYPIRARL